jgi:hypothetical protein
MTKEKENKKEMRPSQEDKRTDFIDVDSIDLERMKTLVSDAPGQSEYALERGGTAFTPTQSGAIKSRAFKVMDQQIAMQMKNIKEQIQVLARQAEDLKKRRILSEEIYQAKIKFEPIVGDIYYLYDSPTGRILSLLSPDDFGAEKLKSQQYTFMAKARLLADCTWQIIEGKV